MRMVLRLPRDPGTVPVTRRTVDTALDALGVDPDCRGDVSLALTEVCANVVRHAQDAVDYTVTVTTTPTACTIDVANAAVEPPGAALVGPDRPASNTSENGRGLAIVRAVMDVVHVVTVPGGIVIHMVKNLIFGSLHRLERVPARS
jgi:serine/threonine-protein kinase RsbW